MKRVVFSARSRRDLDDIFEFHADRNPAFAIELNRRLRSAGRSLSKNPLRGAPLRTRKREIRRVVETGHIILYAAEDVVVILRILHGSRDIAAIVAEMN